MLTSMTKKEVEFSKLIFVIVVLGKVFETGSPIAQTDLKFLNLPHLPNAGIISVHCFTQLKN